MIMGRSFSIEAPSKRVLRIIDGFGARAAGGMPPP